MRCILRPMYSTLVALSLAALATFSTAQTSGSAQTAVLATVNQFVDGFNKGDTKMALAACADQTSIIDDFPPHEWHGTGACAKWMSDFDADAKKNGDTDGMDITGARAYLVIPANFNFKQKGKPVSELGIMALALQKNPAGWEITGWAWTKH